MSIRIDRRKALVDRAVPVRIEDTLSFVEDGDFLQNFRECGLNDDDLEVIQAGITACPNGGEIVPVSKNVRAAIYYIDDTESVVIWYAYFEMTNNALFIDAYFGAESHYMTVEEAAIADAYISSQAEYFSTRHTR